MTCLSYSALCDIFMLFYIQHTHFLLTWQLSFGEGFRIQLVRVLQAHQCLGCTRLIFLVWEILSVYGHVGDEPWTESENVFLYISFACIT